MKQKLLNSTLYVFDVDPYIITEDASEATVIKVQEESYKGFVQMNQSLAEKIVRYNYHTMCVNVPEWAPYADDEDPQGSLTFGIYGSATADAINQIQVQNADNVIIRSWHAGIDLEFPFQTDVEEGQHCVIECKEGISELFAQFDITGAEYLPVRWVNEETGRTWYATYPITNSISIGIDAASPATYKLYLSGNDINDTNLRVDINRNQTPLVDLVDGIDIAQDTLIEVWLLTEDINDYDVSSISTWMNQSTEGGLHYWINMPAEDKTIDIPFIGSSSTYTVTLDGSDIHQHVTVKMNDETVQYEQTYSNIADGTVVEIYPTGNRADYVLHSGAVWTTDHWTAIVNGRDITIAIDYLGAGVNFNANWYGTPENVSQINIGNTSVTGSDLTDPTWHKTVRLYPGQSQIKYFITTGLPTDMSTFKVEFKVDEQTGLEHHYAYKQTDPDTGEPFYTDAGDASGATITNPGTWTYNNTPDTGLPYITFTLPSTDANGNAFVDNTEIRIGSDVAGS